MIANLSLLMRCFLYFLVRGRAKRIVRDPRTVVVVQFGKLGDMVCTTPLFRAIKCSAPRTRVVVVGDRVGGMLLAGNQDVDRYVACGTDITSALAALAEERAQIGITTGPSSRAFALLYLSGIPGIVAPRIEGGPNAEGRLYRALRILGVLVPHRMGQYAPREYLRLLEPLGIVSDDTTKHLVISDTAKETVERFWQERGLTGKKVVGISPSAGNKIKQWPPERFAAVAAHVSRALAAEVLLIAGPHDDKEVRAMRGALTTPVTDAAGAFSIEELKAAIAKLDLFVSVDTGPIYVAEALGVPTVDITGPVDEREQPPTGEKHVVVVPPVRERPQLYVMNPYQYDYAEAVRQVESITTKAVCEAIDTLWKRL